MSVLVWIEQSGEQAVSSSWEVLGKAREVADALEAPRVAAVLGAAPAAPAPAPRGRRRRPPLSAARMWCTP